MYQFSDSKLKSTDKYILIQACYLVKVKNLHIKVGKSNPLFFNKFGKKFDSLKSWRIGECSFSEWP